MMSCSQTIPMEQKTAKPLISTEMYNFYGQGPQLHLFMKMRNKLPVILPMHTSISNKRWQHTQNRNFDILIAAGQPAFMLRLSLDIQILMKFLHQ